MFAGLETLDHVSPSPGVVSGPIRLEFVRSPDSTRSARQNLRNRLKTLDQYAYQHRTTEEDAQIASWYCFGEDLV